MTVSDDGQRATVEFTVAEGCHQELLLVSYTKSEAGWSREMADEQRLVDAMTGELVPGTHTLEVLLPHEFGLLTQA